MSAEGTYSGGGSAGTVKVTASELSNQKNAYLKAAKNMKNVADKVKQVRNQLGGDKMLEEARSALAKLGELLDNRAAGLEIMGKTLETAMQTYTESEKKSVAVSSGFKAHNRDFYGNPVSVGAGGGGGAGAAAAGLGAGAAPAASAPAASAPAASTQTVNYTENYVEVNNYYTAGAGAAGAGAAGAGSWAGTAGVAAAGAAAMFAGQKLFQGDGAKEGENRKPEGDSEKLERLKAELEQLKMQEGGEK